MNWNMNIVWEDLIKPLDGWQEHLDAHETLQQSASLSYEDYCSVCHQVRDCFVLFTDCFAAYCGEDVDRNKDIIDRYIGLLELSKEQLDCVTKEEHEDVFLYKESINKKITMAKMILDHEPASKIFSFDW